MHASLDTSNRATDTPVYAELIVIDGDRRLEPAQMSDELLIFVDPPRLTSELIELVLINGDAEQKAQAIVLPHDADATRIPIRLLRML